MHCLGEIIHECQRIITQCGSLHKSSTKKLLIEQLAQAKRHMKVLFSMFAHYY